MIRIVKCILSDLCIGSLQARPDAMRRFIGKLKGHLQQTNWKLVMLFSRQPDSEVGMDLLRINDCLHDLITKVQ